MSHTKQPGEMLGKPADHYVFVAPSKTRLVMVALLTIAVAALAYGIYLVATVGGRPAAYGSPPSPPSSPSPSGGACRPGSRSASRSTER